MRKKLALLFIVLGLVAMQSNVLIQKAYAAGVQDMSVSITPTTVSTATVVTAKFTPNSAYSNGNVITLSWPSTFTGGASLTAGDVAVTKTGDASFTSAAAGSFTATSLNITLTTSAALNTSSAFQIVIGATNKLSTPASAGNYTFNLTVNNAGADFASAIVGVGSANQVNVTFTVGSSLAFNISTAADAANAVYPYNCTLGTGATTGVNFCQYRLKVSTNSTNGYTVYYSANTGLTKTGYTFAPATGAQIVAGNEGYGFNIFPGAITGTGAITSAVACNTTVGNCNAVTASTTNANFFNAQASTNTVILSSTGANNPGATDTTNTALVTHAATPSATTPSGSYNTTITYNVIAKY